MSADPGAPTSIHRLMGLGRPSPGAVLLSSGQRLVAGILLAVVAACLLVAPRATTVALVAVSLATYVVSTALRAWFVHQGWTQRSIGGGAVTPIPIPDAALPRYTVLVPLYREANVVESLVAHLSRLDYPQRRLEVLLLCEEDDSGTIDAVLGMRLRSPFRLVRVPAGEPRTKPRACNVGLQQALGSLCVIYDAEDRPDLSQLRRAAERFAVAGAGLGCLQARLDYHNHDHNVLTRLFTLEYNFWFDLLLPAVSRRGLPVPLGGTSNHFRVDVLRRLGGWDPFNVTEDADLGMRLFAAGRRTEMLDSVTWEEACSRTAPWVRQRSRWLKGYLQTWLVHSRSRAFRRAGHLRGVVSLHGLVGATVVVNVLNPLFWGLTLVYAVLRGGWIQPFFPRPLLYAGVACLAFGNLAFVYLNFMAVVHRQRWHLARVVLLVPLYWGLMSVAALRAVWQLVYRPHVWEKTPHGLSGAETDPAVLAGTAALGPDDDEAAPAGAVGWRPSAATH